MIYDTAHTPRDEQLEGQNTEGGFPAFQFSVNGSNGCCTRYVEQTEYHKCKSISSSESYAAEGSYHCLHTMGGCNILDSE